MSPTSKTHFYENEICTLLIKNQRLEATIRNMQEVLNDLLHGRPSTPFPKRKRKNQALGETTIPVDGDKTQLSTCRTPPPEHKEDCTPVAKPSANSTYGKCRPKITLTKASPDLRGKFNQRGSGVKTTPPAAPPRDTTKARVQFENSQDSLSKKKKELDT